MSSSLSFGEKMIENPKIPGSTQPEQKMVASKKNFFLPRSGSSIGKASFNWSQVGATLLTWV